MNNQDAETIFGVVVTYNRKSLLMECIASLLNQNRKLDKIVIIDNASTDGTEVMITENFGDRDDLKYLKLAENIGGSGGFYEGIKYCYDMNADWIWIMDDDSEPSINCLQSMVELSRTQPTAGVICPLIQHKYSRHYQWHHHKLLDKYLYKDINLNCIYEESRLLNEEFIEIDSNAFVGPMIRRNLVSLYGLPEKDYFIWIDDLEYIYRLSRHTRCLLSVKSLIFHKDNNIDPNTGSLNRDSIWKLYYGTRNRLLFVKRHQKIFRYKFIFYFRQFATSFKSFIVLLLVKRAGRKSTITLLGFWHGMINKRGKVVQPFKLNI